MLAALPSSGGADGCGIQKEKGSGVLYFPFNPLQEHFSWAEGFFLCPGCF